ncbi:MAG: ferric reductase-like transmembrane domain-containing protein [Azoarcus sp.]|jgi:predicted ferric reductase|nr:ferric reductase-like transmembrane domain-containing protein [Azoarcus sp.]MDD2874192.1 ferric reductase-like transmembrane domain-containing protein [Azoarcus sp.]MDX9837465.1 ferric reductase-like transmembrane domain-containing protein [Azoarcus sp.]
MKRVLLPFLCVITLAWFGALLVEPAPPGTSLPWAFRQQALYITGLWSFALMSLIMVLATRPAWLEAPLGGMDRIYRVHKWAGILAVLFAASHWLIEMADDVIKALFGREGRVPGNHDGGFVALMQDVGEDLGEWAIYALLAMLLITLWRKFPYHLWRYLHHVMPVLYLMLTIHVGFLAPAVWWSQPVGWMLAMFMVAGSAASVVSLTGRIGRRRRVAGTIEAVHTTADGICELDCLLAPQWKGHRAGQFAFVTFDTIEGAHPFTIASADHGDRRVRFEIKALGDYTRGLAGRLRAGQKIQVEGPYGRFDFRKASSKAAQIWIAGGIGITPFLAWLESLQGAASGAPEADLYYSTRCRDEDAFVARLEALCAGLPSITLHIVSTDRDPVLNAERLHRDHGAARRTELWFCGPRAFGDALRTGIVRLGMRGVRFHQEAFEMR